MIYGYLELVLLYYDTLRERSHLDCGLLGRAKSSSSPLYTFIYPTGMLRSFRILYWLPIPIAFTHYCYAIKTVRGRSMQVSQTVTAAPLLISSFSRQSADTQSRHLPVGRYRDL